MVCLGREGIKGSTHIHFLTGGYLNQGKVYCGASVVLGTLGRIRHIVGTREYLPHLLLYRKRSIAVKELKGVALRDKVLLCCYQGLCRSFSQVTLRTIIHYLSEEIICRSILHIQEYFWR